MKPISFFEYLLIISPSEEISRFVWHLKKIFADRYKCTMAASSAPHITVGNWRRSDYDQAKIIASIGRFAKTISPFMAHFDGLGHFKTKTIFVNVLNKEPFAEISEGLKGSTRHLLKHDVIFPGVPHLTVARSMEADQFESAWSEWKSEEFKASCEVNEMILLRRPFEKHEVNRFEKIAVFPFGGTGSFGGQLQLQF